MRPSKLTPGRKVICGGRVMTFIRRDRQPNHTAMNWFQCPDYVGLDGAEDKGLVSMTDHYAAKHIQLKEAA